MSRKVRFGLFVLDAERGELRREGVLVHLQSQPAQVLRCLVERAGEVVSREELRKAVWGDATFVDFDAGLNFCIAQIRAALRDDSAQPLFIRTVPKNGYQFIAPVERLSAEADGSTPTAPADGVVAEGTADARGASGADKKAVFAFDRRAERNLTRWMFASGVLVLAIGGMVLLMVLYLTPRKMRYVATSQAPIVAVARFDNETRDGALDRFADGLADGVVEQLTVKSRDRYRVIGNAQILRLPREQRDLRAIASSLGAGYIVLGQVQGSGGQLRILAHLIRLSDQTHIWVVRLDRPRGDELRLEADVAGQIATEFAARMAHQPEKAPSFAPGSH